MGQRRIIRSLSWGYALTALIGTIVALKNDRRAEPFGFKTKHSVPYDAATGFGTGLSAPWPMVFALLALVRRTDTVSLRLVRCLVVMFAVGQLSEPVTRQLEWRRKPVEKVIVTANIVVPATILAVSYR